MADLDEMLEECMLCSSDLTDWECDFVDSFEIQLAEGLEPQELSVEKLIEIYNKIS